MRISLLSRLLDLISPRACAVCGSRMAVTEEAVCTPCNLHLPRTGFHLHPDDNPMARLFWGQTKICRAASLFFFYPHSETSRIIYGIKYGNRPHTARLMGALMAHEAAAAGFFAGIDVIVPVPLSADRRRQRGYNQSEMLARGVADVTGIAVETRAVERTAFSVSQTNLTRQQRRDNVEGLFRLTDAGALSGRHVLIVDDVMTSGATVMACAGQIERAGGVTLSVLTLAFTGS